MIAGACRLMKSSIWTINQLHCASSGQTLVTLRDVRVADLLENTSDWRTGMWVNTDKLYKLGKNDSLEAIGAFIDATWTKDSLRKAPPAQFAGGMKKETLY